MNNRGNQAYSFLTESDATQSLAPTIKLVYVYVQPIIMAHRPASWCDVCSLDLQSTKSLSEHCEGRKHCRRAGTWSEPIHFPLTEDIFWSQLKAGQYRSIVICTGAGVSTAAGIADFRSHGGLFATIRQKFSRFPEVLRTPETLLSRQFATKYPTIWKTEVQYTIFFCQTGLCSF